VAIDARMKRAPFPRGRAVHSPQSILFFSISIWRVLWCVLMYHYFVVKNLKQKPAKIAY